MKKSNPLKKMISYDNDCMILIKIAMSIESRRISMIEAFIFEPGRLCVIV